jgi:hypothetical protein
MNILHVIHNYYPAIGGVEWFIKSLLEDLCLSALEDRSKGIDPIWHAYLDEFYRVVNASLG